MRSLVNHWCPLTHTSHCMTTSSHTDESESKPSHASQGIFKPDALPATTIPISALRTSSKHAASHTLRLSYLNYRVTLKKLLRYLQPPIVHFPHSRPCPRPAHHHCRHHRHHLRYFHPALTTPDLTHRQVCSSTSAATEAF